ncbi:MAG: hypothetical protein DVB28_001678, partial [Verrucomicrobia bacterium]
MDRTGKIGVALAIITLVVWQIFYSKEMERTRLAQEQAAALVAAEGGATPAAAGNTPAVAGGAPAAAQPTPAASAPAVVIAAGSAPKKSEVLEGSEA